MAEVRLLGKGATGIVYQLNSFIVVKRACLGEEEEADHASEQSMFQLLQSDPPVPHLVLCYFQRPRDTFLEYAPNGSLALLLNQYQKRSGRGQVISISQDLDSANVRRWMLQTCRAVVSLAAHGVCHGDLRPGNILFDHAWNVVLCDLDRTVRWGDDIQVLTEPFGRLLNNDEGDGAGSYGKAGVRTEAFALGSLFYTLLRGHEPYETEASGDDHFQVLSDKLQRREFPRLTDSADDAVIRRCWEGEYLKLHDLLATFDGAGEWLIPSPNQGIMDLRRQECELLIRNGVVDALERAT